MEVAYVYELVNGLRLFRSFIDTGRHKVVSGEVIPANFRIDLIVSSSAVGGGAARAVQAPVEIRGDVDLRAYLAAAGNFLPCCITDAGLRCPSLYIGVVVRSARW